MYDFTSHYINYKKVVTGSSNQMTLQSLHSVSYHEFTEEETHSIRTKLTAWYHANRRKLPWRGDKPPYGNASTSFQANNSMEPPKKKRKLTKHNHNSKQKQTQLLSYFKPNTTHHNSDSKKSANNTKRHTKNTSHKHKEINESMLNITAYHVWISEIMLQQTKVETVIDYYIQWMNTFPNIHTLSAATLDEVNTLWAGLGYYRRAKFIHEASKNLVQNFKATLPVTLKELKSIKGIGDYTAGAISSIAYNQCNAAVDGNLVRVLSRVRAIACASSPPLKIHWDLANALVNNTTNPGILNQSLMELGACICVPKSPKCPLCPIAMHCKAYNEVKQKQRPLGDTQEEEIVTNPCKICNDLGIKDIEDLQVTMYPSKKVRTKVREQVIVSGIVMIGSHVLMIKRPSKGLLAGQWEYPMRILFESKPEIVKKRKKAKKDKILDKEHMFTKLVERLNELYGNEKNDWIANYEYVGSSLHIFSHIKQTCHVFRIYLDDQQMDTKKGLVYDGDYKWLSFQEMNAKKLTMCVKKQWKIHVNFDKSLKNTFKPKVSGKKRKRQYNE
eukprot:715450_1